jgi:hypothetical protein
MTNPTPQQTEEAIFGAGADIYSWWDAPLGAAAFQMQFDYTEGREAPNTWSYLVFADNPDARGWIVVTVGHRHLLTALRAVADPKWSPREGLRGRTCPSEETRENVRAFLGDPEGSTDIDANTADEVLQVAVLGGVVYG